MLSGPPGLGKTTLATILANEMGAAMVTTAGPSLERGGDLMGILTNLNERDVLFVDEIHRLPRVVEELLYPAMEDFTVNFIMDKGLNARTMRIPLRPFTMVGATTRPGMLSSPLRERFGIFHHLDFYSLEELQAIVARSASILGANVEPDGAAAIAKRSRGTPRIANRLLRRVRDYVQVKGSGVVTAAGAVDALDREGVDSAGLDRLDRRFLGAIIEQYGGGPVGLEAIAATINDEAETLAEVVEPFLLKIGFLIRTPTGRKATPPAYVHLGISAPAAPGGAGAATALARAAMADLGKILLCLGLVMVVLGGILLVAGSSAGKVPWLGRLPGDIFIERENWRLYFPLGHLHPDLRRAVAAPLALLPALAFAVARRPSRSGSRRE